MTLETIILIIISIFFFILALVKLTYVLLAQKVGDCAIEWIDGYFRVESVEYPGDWEAIIKFAQPIKSTGKQQCIMVDMIGRVQPEGDKFLSADSNVYIYPGGNRRSDRYWEAALIKPSDTLIVKGELVFKSQDEPVKNVLAKLGDVNIDLFYKYYCRNKLVYKRKIIKIVLAALPGVVETGRIKSEFMTIDRGQKVLPVRTPLLGAKDNIYSVFETYVKQHLKDGDILAVCESALAIMEGRMYYVEDINPGFLATHLNKIFKMDSSLSSPYSLEMAIREVGAFRIILAFIIGALGKLMGRAGDFYAFAGRAVATIDDCTGTLPPYDKYVVMGPKNPQKTVKEFKEKTGVDLTVVDVNDLGKVDVLGVSDPSLKSLIQEALKTNPQGNANEQTPIALIRREKES